MNFSFVFIGSTHGFVDDFLKQKEIIQSINPEFVLSEELEDLKLDSKEKFSEILEKRKISNMTSFDEVEKLIRLCFEKNIKLIGIDFHNFGFDDNLQKKIKNQEEPTGEDEKKINKILEMRAKNHLSKILEYQKKTSRPIVIILGAWHLRNESLLRKELKNYKIIIPCDKRGNPLFEPNENKEIKSLEIISDDIKTED